MRTFNLKICGMRYRVRILDKKDPEGEAWGRVDYDSTTITLFGAVELSRERQLEIIVHECLHALIHETGSRRIVPGRKNEELVTRLSAPMLGLFRDNAAAFREIGGGR